jgi:N-acetylneuraminic acid mutarotase
VTIDDSNAEGVVEVARFFHIEWLIQISRHYLVYHLAFEDYQLTVSLADQYVLGDIRSAFLSLIGNSFYYLFTKPRFLRLQFEALNDLLSGEWFIAATEGNVLQAVNMWLKHDLPSREQYCIPLLKLILFPLLDLEELETINMSEFGIAENPDLAKMITDARDYNSIPSRRCLMHSNWSCARGSQPYLVIYSGVEDENEAEYRPLVVKKDRPCDIIREELVTSTFLESVFEFAAVAVLGDYLFIAGGYNRDMLSCAFFYSYSPHRRCWTQLSTMLCARVNHALVAAKDVGLYAVAGVNHYFDDSVGIDRDQILESVEFYDPRNNLWHEMPLLPFGAFNIGATFADNRLYVTGGISDNPEHNVPVGFVNCCRPSDDGWTILANMNHERHSHSIIAHREKLYVFGGLAAGDDTMGFVDCLFNEVYDIETDQWTDLIPMSPGFGHIRQQSVVIGDHIIVLGSRENYGFFMCEFNEESGKLEESQSCGTCVHKVVVFETAFPSCSVKDFIHATI